MQSRVKAAATPLVGASEIPPKNVFFNPRQDEAGNFVQVEGLRLRLALRATSPCGNQDSAWFAHDRELSASDFGNRTLVGSPFFGRKDPLQTCIDPTDEMFTINVRIGNDPVQNSTIALAVEAVK